MWEPILEEKSLNQAPVVSLPTVDLEWTDFKTWRQDLEKTFERFKLQLVELIGELFPWENAEKIYGEFIKKIWDKRHTWYLSHNQVTERIRYLVSKCDRNFLKWKKDWPVWDGLSSVKFMELVFDAISDEEINSLEKIKDLHPDAWNITRITGEKIAKIFSLIAQKPTIDLMKKGELSDDQIQELDADFIEMYQATWVKELLKKIEDDPHVKIEDVVVQLDEKCKTLLAQNPEIFDRLEMLTRRLMTKDGVTKYENSFYKVLSVLKGHQKSRDEAVSLSPKQIWLFTALGTWAYALYPNVLPDWMTHEAQYILGIIWWLSLRKLWRDALWSYQAYNLKMKANEKIAVWIWDIVHQLTWRKILLGAEEIIYEQEKRKVSEALDKDWRCKHIPFYRMFKEVRISWSLSKKSIVENFPKAWTWTALICAALLIAHECWNAYEFEDIKSMLGYFLAQK